MRRSVPVRFWQHVLASDHPTQRGGAEARRTVYSQGVQRERVRRVVGCVAKLRASNRFPGSVVLQFSPHEDGARMETLGGETLGLGVLFGSEVFTERDQEVLHVLTHRVRVLSAAQLARTWWPGAGSDRAAVMRMRHLERAGHVTVHDLPAHPELSLEAPLATWQPGLPSPDLAVVAKQCAERFTASHLLTTCVVATEAAHTWLASPGGHFPRDTELSHDLHLSQVYLRMRRMLPTRARSWQREEAFQTIGTGDPPTKRPDAFVRDGLHRTAIECAGSYSRARLDAFHLFCEQEALAYELW